MSFVYITEEGAYIHKRSEVFVVGRNNETIMEIPGQILEGLVLIGSVQVSSEAMVEFLRLGVPVTWLSNTGKFFGRLESTKHVNVFRQQRQVLLSESNYFFQLSKKVVFAKVHNQLTFLRRANRRAMIADVDTAILNILSIRKNINSTINTEQLMGYEGIIAKVYFDALGKLMPEDFTFNCRSKQPPLDKFNSMLSFGYTLVLYEIYTAIINQGLSPYFGFLHSLKNHHPALASDLLEEWRAVLIDSLALSLIRHKEITKEHFHKSKENNGIYLTRDGRNIFLKAYERKMRERNSYVTENHSFRHSLGHQVAQYAQSIMAENVDMYEPIKIR